MSYNEILFENIYNACVYIIEKSDDKYIKKKKEKLDFAYKKVQDLNDCEVQEFFATAHELKTYEMLKGLKLLPVANNDETPGVDFTSKLGNIECVTFMKPSDELSKRILSGNLNRHKAYEPRVTQALNEKLNKYKSYLSKWQIDASRPNIICLNPGICGYDIHYETFITACQRVLYGVGDEALIVNRETNERTWSHLYQNKIIKPNGQEINADIFNTDDYKIISGILLIDNLVDKPYTRPILYINPNANVKIDRRSIKKVMCLLKHSDSAYHYVCNGKATNIYKYKGIG